MRKFILLSVFAPILVHANMTQTKLVSTGFDQLPKAEQASIAKNFYLTRKEYEQYQYDMSKTPDAYLISQKFDPNLVLAMHAKAKAQYDRYLKNAVKIEWRVTLRLLKVSRDFTKMAKEVHPGVDAV